MYWNGFGRKRSWKLRGVIAVSREYRTPWNNPSGDLGTSGLATQRMLVFFTVVSGQPVPSLSV